MRSQRCHAPGMVTLEVGCNLEPEQSCCFATIPAPVAITGTPCRSECEHNSASRESDDPRPLQSPQGDDNASTQGLVVRDFASITGMTGRRS